MIEDTCSENMFYCIALVLENKSYFMIYSMGDSDQLVSKGKRYLIFDSRDSLESYSSSHLKLKIQSENTYFYKLDYIEKFVTSENMKEWNSSENMKKWNSSEIYNCWNLFDDLEDFDLPSYREYFEYSNQSRNLHQKLLFEIDVFCKGDGVPQEWLPNESQRLKIIMRHGMTNIKYIINHCCPVNSEISMA